MTQAFDSNTINYFHDFYDKIIVKRLYNGELSSETKVIKILERAKCQYTTENIIDAYFKNNSNYFLINIGYYDYALDLYEFLYYATRHVEEFETELFQSLKEYCGH